MHSQYVSTLNNLSEIRRDDPNDVYKQPIPLDMINKFVGLDSRILLHDTTVQKQAFDQSYKNFWSFVDFNMKYGSNATGDNQNCNHTFTQSVKPEFSVTGGKMCSGSTLTYEIARERANQLYHQ
jgi:hypothetical protein